MLLGRIAIISFIVTLISIAYAQPIRPTRLTVVQGLKGELIKQFPGTRIEFTDEFHWTSNAPNGPVLEVRAQDANARAQVQFMVLWGSRHNVQRSFGWTTFAAYLPARVLARRVMPGEKLSKDQFTLQDVNVASGENHELRGVILDQKTDISHLQARQTLLEGQPLLSSAVERIPDVQRGDEVRLRLVAGGIVLSTEATASEPGYLNGEVHVLTDKTKREMTGKLVSSGVVEVKL